MLCSNRFKYYPTFGSFVKLAIVVQSHSASASAYAKDMEPSDQMESSNTSYVISRVIRLQFKELKTYLNINVIEQSFCSLLTEDANHLYEWNITFAAKYIILMKNLW